jgi:hypothetical protein
MTRGLGGSGGQKVWEVREVGKFSEVREAGKPGDLRIRKTRGSGGWEGREDGKTGV